MPIQDVISAMGVPDLPNNWIPVDGVVLIRCLDEDGMPKWAVRYTDGINAEELLGALVVQVELLRRDILTTWVDESD